MGTDAMLAIEGLRLDYDLGSNVYQALKGIDLEIAAGEFFTLLGPSGCGKTTTLRSVAGLEFPTGGSIRIGGKPVFDAAQGIRLPPNRRDLSMVFQSYAIWPHMTVGANVAFPIETEGLSRADRTARVRRALEMVGLAEHLDRPASLLSGGQQQRVALARALVRDTNLRRTARVAAAGRQDHALRHPRPGRGAQHVRPVGADARRRDRRVGHAG
jgi:iron(III) transport system ATP-binding protein